MPLPIIENGRNISNSCFSGSSPVAKLFVTKKQTNKLTRISKRCK